MLNKALARMFATETCYSSNKSPFNKEQNDPNLESVANMVTELWLFLHDECVIMLTDWQEAPLSHATQCHAAYSLPGKVLIEQRNLSVNKQT